MPQSLMQVYLHIIFSTKKRLKLIDSEIEDELYNYLSTISKEHDNPIIKIGGVEDHIHILCRFGKTHTIPQLLENLKKSSSKWIKTKGYKYRNFFWQNGYATISVNPSQINNLIDYINNQKEHHKHITFEEELMGFLKQYGIEYDERYLFD